MSIITDHTEALADAAGVDGLDWYGDPSGWTEREIRAWQAYMADDTAPAEEPPDYAEFAGLDAAA